MFIELFDEDQERVLINLLKVGSITPTIEDEDEKDPFFKHGVIICWDTYGTSNEEVFYGMSYDEIREKIAEHQNK